MITSMTTMEESSAGRRWYSLCVLTSVYVIGELSHFLLGIVTRPMSQDIHYGDQECIANPNSTAKEINCFEAGDNDSCRSIGQVDLSDNSSSCVWDFSGLGLEYQILAGPSFIAVFTLAGVVIATISDRSNRHVVVSVCLIILTTATTLTGAAKYYWQLVLLRMSIGVGESAFAPACDSIIADMFTQDKRGLALGIFNWGIYFGYGLSYAIGNFVTQSNILNMGWRWSYYISGMLGYLVFVTVVFSVKEPPRRTVCACATSTKDGFPPEKMEISESKSDAEVQSPWKQVIFTICNPVMVLLIIAASARHTAGFTWAYNTQLYFATYYPTYNLGIWITAVSIGGGSCGVAIGGFVSDKLVGRLGLRARTYILAGSQILAAPFATGVLYLAPPYAFFSLLGSYFFAEMWFGVLFAVLLEFIPTNIQSTTLAVFLFIMNNIGGNAPMLVEPLRKAITYRGALLCLYPGLYVLSSLLFFSSSFFIKKSLPQSL